jgi:hypothetical protein
MLDAGLAAKRRRRSATLNELDELCIQVAWKIPSSDPSHRTDIIQLPGISSSAPPELARD